MATRTRVIPEYKIEESDADDEIRQLAIKQYGSEGRIEIDDGAVVSIGNAGAYVAAWVFIDKEDIPSWEED